MQDYDFTLWVGKKRSVRDLRMILDERQPSLKMCKRRGNYSSICIVLLNSIFKFHAHATISDFSCSCILVIQMLRPLAASKFRVNDDDDDDVAVIDVPEVRLSLKCPVSKTRLVTPCRGLHCQHIQAFDGDTFLTMNERRPTWRCFVCDKIIWFEDLYCDSFVKHLACNYADADALDLLLDVDAIESNQQQGADHEIDGLKIVPHSDADEKTADQNDKQKSNTFTRSAKTNSFNAFADAGDAGDASSAFASKNISAVAKRKNVEVIEVESDSDGDEDGVGQQRPESQMLLSDSGGCGGDVATTAELGKRSSGVAELDSVGSPSKRPHVSQITNLPDKQPQNGCRQLTGVTSSTQPTSLLQLMHGCGSRGDLAGHRVEIKLESVSSRSQPSLGFHLNRLGPGLTVAPSSNSLTTSTSASLSSAVQPFQHGSRLLPNDSGSSQLRRSSLANREVSQNPGNNTNSLIEWFVSGSTNGLKPNQTPAPDRLLPIVASPSHSQRSGSFSHFGGTSVPVTYDVVSSTFVPVTTAASDADNTSGLSSDRGPPSIYSRSNIGANSSEAADYSPTSATHGVSSSNSRSRRIAGTVRRSNVAAVASAASAELPNTEILTQMRFQPQSNTASTGNGAALPLDSSNSSADWSALLSQALLSSLYGQLLSQQQQLLPPQSGYPYAAYSTSGVPFANANALSANYYQQQQQQQYENSLQFLSNLQAVCSLASTASKPDTPATPVTGTGMAEQENNSPEHQFYAAAVTPTAVITSNGNSNDIAESSLLSLNSHEQHRSLYDTAHANSTADDGELISNGHVASAMKNVAEPVNIDPFYSSSAAQNESASALLNSYLMSLLQQHPADFAEPTTATSAAVQLGSSSSTPTNQ